MRQKLLTPLIVILVVSFGGLLATLIAGYEPALGLDLQGGISVTQQPVGDYSTESLDLAVDRIRERVDSLGVAEPEIIRQGDAIVVNLPGVKNQQQAIDLVKVTGQVYLRPVLQCIAGAPTTDTSTDSSTATSTATSTEDTASGASTPDDTATVDTASIDTQAPAATAGDGPSRAPHGASDTSVPDTTSSDTASSDSQDTATEDTATADTATADTATADTTTADTATADTATADTATADTTGGTVTQIIDPATATTAPVSDPTTSQILPLRGGGQCYVGPAGGTGEVFQDDAVADILQGSGWGVVVGLRGGSAGEGVWNALASACYSGSESCPSKQLAIELDGEIVSAPTVNSPTFNGNVQISGSFTESEARQLARVLKSGSLPVQLQLESVQNVSPTLGKDSLRAAWISGLVGVVLVLVFMIFYYRLLGLIVVVGLSCRVALLWSVIIVLSKTQGLALSLSGCRRHHRVRRRHRRLVRGVLRAPEGRSPRSGPTMRNSAQRGFTGAWHTIVVADLVSLIGALVLWYLTVGAVRGSPSSSVVHACDLLVSPTSSPGPAVLLLARTKWMERRKVMGIEVPLPEVRHEAIGMTSHDRRSGRSPPPRGLRRRDAARSVRPAVPRRDRASTSTARRWWGFTGCGPSCCCSSAWALFVRGLNLSLDFKGGVVWEVPSERSPTEHARAILDDNGLEGNREGHRS
jgi:preprotein translocase subunit SecD